MRESCAEDPEKGLNRGLKPAHSDVMRAFEYPPESVVLLQLIALELKCCAYQSSTCMTGSS